MKEGRPGMSTAAVADEPSGTTEIELSVQGMTCAACAARVERKLNGLDQVRASVNFATERATITAPPGVTPAMLIEAIEQAGYGAADARPPAGSATTDDDIGQDDGGQAAYLRRRLILAVIFFIPLSDLSVALSLFPAFRFTGWQWDGDVDLEFRRFEYPPPRAGIPGLDERTNYSFSLAEHLKVGSSVRLR
jgi:P-type Cu+ transporter